MVACFRDLVPFGTVVQDPLYAGGLCHGLSILGMAQDVKGWFFLIPIVY